MTRGGTRTGAGRPARPNAKRHNIMVDAEVWNWLNRNKRPSEEITKLVTEAKQKPA